MSTKELLTIDSLDSVTDYVGAAKTYVDNVQAAVDALKNTAEGYKDAAQLSETNAKASEEQATASVNALSTITFDRGFSGDDDVSVVPTTTGAVEGDKSWYITNDSLQIIRLESGTWEDFGEPIATKKALDDKASLLLPKDPDKINVGGLEGEEDLNIKSALRQKTTPLSPTIVFVADDGYINDYDELLPIMNNKGAVACSSVIAGSQGGSYMTYDQLRELQDVHGWEIISHSTDNLRFDEVDFTVEQGIQRFIDSKNQLKDEGLNIESWCWPGGDNTGTFERLMRDYYRTGLGVHGTALNGQNFPPIDTTDLKRIELTSDLDAAKGIVDEAESNNNMTIFMIHTTASFDWDNVKVILPDLIDYIDSKNISIKTLSDALDMFSNRQDVGGDLNAFKIGGDGLPYHGTNIRQKARNSVTIDTPIEDFEAGAVTYCEIVSNGDFPDSNGVLETINFKDLVYKQFYYSSFNKIYRWERYWDANISGWRPFIRCDGDFDARANPVSTTPPSEYGRRITAQNYPIDGNGTYFTIAEDADGYSHQIKFPPNGGLQIRTFTSFGAWGEFRTYKNVIEYTVSDIDFGTLVAGETKTINIEGQMAGAPSGSNSKIVFINPNGNFNNNLIWNGIGYGNLQYLIQLHNPTASSVTPPVINWIVKIIP